MPNIVFAAISPHPPLILPKVGSKKDKGLVQNTIQSLERLGLEMRKVAPDSITISSPHEDWGFNVPLHFLAPDFKGEMKHYLTGMEPPEFHFNEGKRAYWHLRNDKKHALIASGDLSHCLKEDGPYGFNLDGPKFDKELVRYLENKDVKHILQLEDDFPGAGECGLRSFAFLLGILEAAKINWRVEVLSYEGPLGVGYLVANFKLK